MSSVSLDGPDSSSRWRKKTGSRHLPLGRGPRREPRLHRRKQIVGVRLAICRCREARIVDERRRAEHVGDRREPALVRPSRTAGDRRRGSAPPPGDSPATPRRSPARGAARSRASGRRRVARCRSAARCPAARAGTARRMAVSALCPVDTSSIPKPGSRGSASSPRSCAESPPAACADHSTAGRSRSGPVSPKPEMEQKISSGLIARSRSHSSPNRSAVPGR